MSIAQFEFTVRGPTVQALFDEAHQKVNDAGFREWTIDSFEIVEFLKDGGGRTLSLEAQVRINGRFVQAVGWEP